MFLHYPILKAPSSRRNASSRRMWPLELGRSWGNPDSFFPRTHSNKACDKVKSTLIFSPISQITHLIWGFYSFRAAHLSLKSSPHKQRTTKGEVEEMTSTMLTKKEKARRCLCNYMTTKSLKKQIML